MNTVTLYKNPYPYPYFGGITTYKTITATPRNQDVKSGFIDVQMTQDEVFSFNYLSFTRNGKTVYAWVENVEHRTGLLGWRVHYSTDAYRTYKNDIVYGTQYIARSPQPTLLEDELLSSTKEYNDYDVKEYSVGQDSGANPQYRYCVVQVRRTSDIQMSNTPGQITPYNFFVCPYLVNNWTNSPAIIGLVDALSGEKAESSNVVTIYSVPYVDLSKLALDTLRVKVGDKTVAIDDWWFMGQFTRHDGILTAKTTIDIPEGLTKTRHNVSLVFPDAGIMNIPDELLYKDGLVIRQDIDIFSGACNYMLATENGEKPTHLSVRGSALSTIPILSNPYDTYISQNQNTLAVGLLGDVANLGLGIYKGDPMQTGLGVTGLVDTFASLEDAKMTIPSNPPAFLGSALVSRFNQLFYRVITKKPYDNENEVRARYGYPYHRIAKLTPPTKGFIQTRNCSVSSNGNVPLWAINEINSLFNNGILFK